MDERRFLGSNPIFYPAGFRGLSVPNNWITDAVVAARFCETGLSGLDYHGKQPVSRNSKILTGSPAAPAIRFGLFRNGFIPLTIGKYEAAPWCCYAELMSGSRSAGEFFAMAQGKSVLITVKLFENQPVSLRFQTNSLNTDVHGNMCWKKDRSVFPLIFVGENRCLLRDWVADKGAYLVPVFRHAEIFGTGPLLDVNNLDALPPMTDTVKNGGKLFIDSRTVLVLNSAHPVQVTDENGECTLTFAESAVHFDLSFGDSTEEALFESARVQKNHPQISQEQFLRFQKRAERKPAITFDEYPELGEAAAALPGYVLAATQSSGMTRASASSYYWVWGWDNLVTAHEMSKWGDPDGQRSVIRFFLSHRWLDGSTPHRYGRDYEILQTMQFGASDALLISLIHQYFSETGDREFLKECYPAVTELWNGLKKKSDSRGYIRGLGFYPDNPRAMGRAEQGVTSLETGAFFLAARLLTGLASACGDEAAARSAAQTADLIESTFLDSFFDSETGGLIDGLDERGQANKVYPLYDYLAAHNRRGLALFLPEIGRISDFIEKNYFTEHGIRTLPAREPHTHSESIHHAWYPHWDIYALKLLRYGALASGDDERFLRISRQYAETVCRMWKNCRAIMELADLDDLDPETGWTKFGQAWNLNCASGLYRTWFESLAGIMTDGGTVSVLPGGLQTRISGLWACGGRWSFNRSGRGGFSHLIVDDAPIYSSCLVPKEFYTRGNHQVTAVYGTSDQNPLILDFIGGKISELRQNGGGSAFQTTLGGKLLLLSDTEPLITLDGSPVKARNLNARLWQVSLQNPGNIFIGGPT
ncbi:MAG TPA: hypothetical protein PK854_02530 [Oscillospiraceae bacterium]|nr:hypothetical protein [Oscillospiraceae bacterium]HPS34121.1 hypothetical protein [Oscillospiraceae bacterium]